MKQDLYIAVRDAFIGTPFTVGKAPVGNVTVLGSFATVTLREKANGKPEFLTVKTRGTCINYFDYPRFEEEVKEISKQVEWYFYQREDIVRIDTRDTDITEWVSDVLKDIVLKAIGNKTIMLSGHDAKDRPICGVRAWKDGLEVYLKQEQRWVKLETPCNVGTMTELVSLVQSLGQPDGLVIRTWSILSEEVHKLEEEIASTRGCSVVGARDLIGLVVKRLLGLELYHQSSTP